MKISNRHFSGVQSTRAFSLIEMMIAIVILGLGLVMVATMFPIAWTRARTLTEYTTQRAIAQSAAATIAESIRPSGSTFVAYEDNGTKTGKFFLATAGLAGDLVYDSQLHNELPPIGLYPDEKHSCLLAPSDTRVHVLHLENRWMDPTKTDSPNESPHLLEMDVGICDMTKSPPTCRNGFYGLTNNIPQCSAAFCSISYQSPQASIGARVYPPMSAPPNSGGDAATRWLDQFSNRRFSWAALHRLRSFVGPEPRAVVDAPGYTIAQKAAFAAQVAQAAGTTRVFDFYVVTLKRAQPTSRFARQNTDPANVPDPRDRAKIVKPIPQASTEDMALPLAWRVQIELPKMKIDDPANGIPTEVQVPPSSASTSPAENVMLAGMFPVGTQFVDEVTGRIYRVARQRTTSDEHAILTLDRQILPQDIDDSDPNQFPGASGTIDPHEIVRTVWVFPPPIAERPNATTVTFDNSSPVVGIDVKTLSMTPPG